MSFLRLLALRVGAALLAPVIAFDDAGSAAWSPLVDEDHAVP